MSREVIEVSSGEDSDERPLKRSRHEEQERAGLEVARRLQEEEWGANLCNEDKTGGDGQRQQESCSSSSRTVRQDKNKKVQEECWFCEPDPCTCKEAEFGQREARVALVRLLGDGNHGQVWDAVRSKKEVKYCRLMVVYNLDENEVKKRILRTNTSWQSSLGVNVNDLRYDQRLPPAHFTILYLGYQSPVPISLETKEFIQGLVSEEESAKEKTIELSGTNTLSKETSAYKLREKVADRLLHDGQGVVFESTDGRGTHCLSSVHCTKFPSCGRFSGSYPVSKLIFKAWTAPIAENLPLYFVLHRLGGLGSMMAKRCVEPVAKCDEFIGLDDAQNGTILLGSTPPQKGSGFTAMKNQTIKKALQLLRFVVGTKVVVMGLVNNDCYNFKQGTVIENRWDEQLGKCKVLLTEKVGNEDKILILSYDNLRAQLMQQ